MKMITKACRNGMAALLFALLSLFPAAVQHVHAGEYQALENVEQLQVVFDVSVGAPQGANNVFWAVRNLYQENAVTALPQQSKVAVVFRGPAVKLISGDLSKWKEKDRQLVTAFQETVKKMTAEGVVFEVCQYAMKKSRVDPATVMKEVNQVGNGFVSIAGYQMQGYGVIAIQ